MTITTLFLLILGGFCWGVAAVLLLWLLVRLKRRSSRDGWTVRYTVTVREVRG